MFYKGLEKLIGQDLMNINSLAITQGIVYIY